MGLNTDAKRQSEHVVEGVLRRRNSKACWRSLQKPQKEENHPKHCHWQKKPEAKTYLTLNFLIPLSSSDTDSELILLCD